MQSFVAQCAVFPVTAGQIRDGAISPAVGCRLTEVTSRFPGRSSRPGKGGGGAGCSPSKRARRGRPGRRRAAAASAACRERGGAEGGPPRGGGVASAAATGCGRVRGASVGRAGWKAVPSTPPTAAPLPDPLRAPTGPPPACGQVGGEGRCNRTAEEQGGCRKVWGPLGAGELYQRSEKLLTEGGRGKGVAVSRREAEGAAGDLCDLTGKCLSGPTGAEGTGPWWLEIGRD